MINNVKILFVSVGVIAFVSPLVYLTVKYNDEKSINLQLNQVLNETLKEKEQLQTYTAQIEEQIKEKESRLKELSDVAAIRNSLNNAQDTIGELNKEINKINKERSGLQDENMNLDTRLQNTNRELMRTVEDLRLTKAEVVKLDGSQMGAFKRKVEELNKTGEVKDQELNRLKDDLKKIQLAHADLLKNNKELEKKFKELQAAKASATAAVSAKDGIVAPSDASMQELQDNIDELNAILSKKEGQIKELEIEIAKLEASPGAGLAKTGRQQKIIEELNANNKELKEKVADLESELMMAKAQTSRSKRRPDQSVIGELYEKARDQVNKITEILVKKELEIDLAKKESMEAKEKLVNLQARLSSLENEVAFNKTSRDKIKEMERENLSLQSRLSELQETIKNKSALSESLQKNLEYLTTQLSKREDEIRTMESRFSKIGSATADELERQKSRYEEINLLYNSLKTQVSQFADALNQKELDLEQIHKESSALKSRSERLERELADAKEQQRRTLDDLVAAVRLNTLLQERITGVSPVKESPKPISEQQKKADDLKRKIEVILEPER